MIKSIEIKNNINLKVLNYKDKNLIILKNDNREIFFLNKSEMLIKDRIVLSDKKTINRIKQGMDDLLLWNKRKVILKGVGSRCEILDGELRIKVSNTLKIFIIKEDINVKIINNPLSLIIWGININDVDKFKNDILKIYPKLKKYQ